MRRLAGFAVIALVGSLAGAQLASAAGLGPPEGVDAPPGSVDVQLLAINDFHGQLPPPGGSTGGIEYLAAHLSELEATNPNTLVLSGGDLIGASPLVSGLFHDEPTIEAMNELGMDLATVGNHEFDEGLAELHRMQAGGCHPVDGCQTGHTYAGAEFQYLAANVVGRNGKPIFPPYKIRSFAGARIGIIGVATTVTPMIVTASAVEGLTFLDETDTVNRYAEELRSKGVNTIVVLLHEGVGFGSPTVTAMDPAVRVVISGHSHGAYNFTIGDRIVTNAGATGVNITDIDLTIDRSSGTVTAASAVNVPVTRDVTPDREASGLLGYYTDLAAPLANRVIGSITADLSRATLGPIIADAQLEATASPGAGGAVVAFMNSGGIRDGLRYAQVSGGELPGEVTYGEAFAVQPFSNTLVTKTMTGAQIEAVLDHGFIYHSTNLTRAWTGTDYEVRIDGALIEATSRYRVTMNSFLADGGDGFVAFRDGTDPLAGMNDLDALVAYFGAHSPLSP